MIEAPPRRLRAVDPSLRAIGCKRRRDRRPARAGVGRRRDVRGGEESGSRAESARRPAQAGGKHGPGKSDRHLYESICAPQPSGQPSRHGRSGGPLHRGKGDFRNHQGAQRGRDGRVGPRVGHPHSARRTIRRRRGDESHSRNRTAERRRRAADSSAPAAVRQFRIVCHGCSTKSTRRWPPAGRRKGAGKQIDPGLSASSSRTPCS